jgi:hypothetical protein
MSHKLVLQIANNQLAEATETLHEELAAVVDAKLHEKKKMIAASSVNENRYKQQDRKNPKGLAEGKNPDRNLSDAGKEYNIHKLRVSASDEDPAMSGTLERIARAREIAMKKKALKEAMSAKEAAAKAEKLVYSRTKENEKTRRARNNKGRGSDTEVLTPSGTETKAKTSFERWLNNKGKK